MNSSNVFTLIFLLIIVFAFLCILIYQNRKFKNEISIIKKLSLDRQRSILKGQITEQISPLLPNFPIKSSELYHFGGKLIDFIGFEGINDGEIKRIWFIDSKYNSSRLNKDQKSLKKLIKEINSDKLNFFEYKIKN